MRARLINPQSTEWLALLDRVRHDIAHHPRNVLLSAPDRGGGQAVAGVVEDGKDTLFAPLFISRCPSGELFDASSPRPFSGPTTSASPDAAGERFCSAAFACLFDELASQRVVSVYLRPHPLLPIPNEILAKYGDLRHHQDSVSIDLNNSEPELWAQLRKNHRRDIARSSRSGHTVALDPHWSHISRFVTIYSETMRRVGAEDHWILDEEYFLKLRQAMGDALRLYVVLDGETVAAGGLFSHHEGIVDYLYSGTADLHRSSSPLKSLLWEVAIRSKSEGASALHLGGGPARDDSLHRFKTGFSPRLHPILSLRVITRPSDYHAFAAAQTSRGTIPTDFFPSYRAPVA